jgi:hypothetical protein
LLNKYISSLLLIKGKKEGHVQRPFLKTRYAAPSRHVRASNPSKPGDLVCVGAGPAVGDGMTVGAMLGKIVGSRVGVASPGTGVTGAGVAVTPMGIGVAGAGVGAGGTGVGVTDNGAGVTDAFGAGVAVALGAGVGVTVALGAGVAVALGIGVGVGVLVGTFMLTVGIW